MPKICYVEKTFRPDKLKLIELCNDVIDTYTALGYQLTLRQVYYQMVARGIIPNEERSYKNLGTLINDARLAGLIDWDAIEDRTRNLEYRSKWNSPGHIIKVISRQYHIDYWEGMDYHVRVLVEKDALKGIVGQICDELDVPYFSCRGYVSQTEMWNMARDLMHIQSTEGKTIVLLHLGDHDPSGIDMSRDIQERNRLFEHDYFIFKRLALNMDQIEDYDPPPNPAKITDPRANDYISKYGTSSWELDALEPSVISDLIRENVLEYRDEDIYQQIKKREEEEIGQLRKLADGWQTISDRWDELSDYFEFDE
jgi:hypothetical protein